jgi:hypothetical protein
MPELQEFCACTVYPPGEECGMVVCWKCEQPIGLTDEYGAITIAAMIGVADHVRVTDGAGCPANHGRSCCGYPKICRKALAAAPEGSERP